MTKSDCLQDKISINSEPPLPPPSPITIIEGTAKNCLRLPQAELRALISAIFQSRANEKLVSKT